MTNGWEKIAKRQIENAYNYHIGGLENSVSDGEMTQEEFEKAAADYFEEIYHEAMNTRYEPGFCGGKAPKEMRFAGREFCRKYLEELYEKDGLKYNKEEKNMKNYNNMTVKELRAEAKANGVKGYGHMSKSEIVAALEGTQASTVKVELLAFTGMKIAEFTAELKDGEYIVVTARGAELHFNAEGTQLNAKNPKFGNKIKFIENAAV